MTNSQDSPERLVYRSTTDELIRRQVPYVPELVLEKSPPLWQPLLGPQSRAFESDADELFYGGAAGGGKSDLLLGLAATKHQHSIVFRRNYPAMRALIE